METKTKNSAKPSIQLLTAIPGPKGQEILARRAAALPAGAARSTDVVVASARGAVVKDVDGNTLLDFAGGIGMINVGHSPANVVNAVKRQLDKFIHTCQIVTTMEAPIQLAELLNRIAPGDFTKKTLLCNSGSEAVENAVNIAKYYTQRPAVIVFEGAYHGRTHLTLSLTSKYNLFKKGFGSMASDIYRLPAPNMYRIPEGMSAPKYLDYCLARLDEALISQVDPAAVAAILIEPVLGEGGFIPIPAPFLQKLRDIADQHGIVLIFDEIQCGMGRTGKLWACEHAGVVPDMITTAKSMGAGIEAVKTIISSGFQQKTERVGEQMRRTMEAWKKKYPLIGDVRGLGAMRLVEFVKDRQSKTPDPELTLEIIKDATAHGILLIRAGLYSNCIRLLPPLVITRNQLAEGLLVLEDAIRRAHEKRGL